MNMPDNNPMMIADQTRVAELNLTRLLEWNTRYDAKATAITAIDLGMLGSELVISNGRLNSNSEISFSLMIFILGLALIVNLYASFPRLKSKNNSLLYFGTIAKKELSSYTEEFMKLDSESYLRDILQQCYRNSQIIKSKFFWLKISFYLTFISILPWVITLIVV